MTTLNDTITMTMRVADRLNTVQAVANRMGGGPAAMLAFMSCDRSTRP